MIDLRALSEYSAKHDGVVGFAPTVVRFLPSSGRVCLMNRQRGGWSSSAYTYESLWALAEHWRLVFVDLGEDEHSRFIRVEPLPKD